jgi:hypothetical protein
MLWKLLQLTVFFGVAFTGIHYEWTPNGLVLGLVAALAAFAVTAMLSEFFRLLRWARQKLRFLRDESPEKRLPTRW